MATTFPVLPPDGHRGVNHQIPRPQPNSHPYAIKTTSTALLTRSNSSNHHSQTSHFYVPSSPSPASKHYRHSKSEVTVPVSPRPLPAPPSPSRIGGYASADDAHTTAWRTRAETLPGSASLPQLPTLPGHAALEDLPSNPRVWTTTQLASYLLTALRVRSKETLPLPLPVAQHVAAFIKEARLTGRTFLRLSEADLELMGVNNLWRAPLLAASRNLRQNVLKGRIWGFNGAEASSPTTSPSTSPIRNKHVITKSPFSHTRYNSSSSSIDEVEEEEDVTPSKSRGSRVRGMVETLERTASEEEVRRSPSPTRSPVHMPRPTTVTGAWVDKEVLHAGSGSEGDGDDEAASDSPTKPDFCDSPSSASSGRPLPLTPSDSLSINPPRGFRSEFTHAPDNPAVAAGDHAEEPSMQELLEITEHNALGIGPTTQIKAGETRVVKGKRWGAEAWEDVNLNATSTVKRAVLPPPPLHPIDLSIDGVFAGEIGQVVKEDKGKGKAVQVSSPSKRAPLPPLPVPLDQQETGSLGKAPDVSIFVRPLPPPPKVDSRSASPIKMVGSRPGSPVRLMAREVQTDYEVEVQAAVIVHAETCEAMAQTDNVTDSAEVTAAAAAAHALAEATRRLESVESYEIERLHHTRTLVDAFRARLEEVERRVEEMEQREEERERLSAELLVRGMQAAEEPVIIESSVTGPDDQPLSDSQEVTEPASHSSSDTDSSTSETGPVPLDPPSPATARTSRPAHEVNKRPWRDLALAGENHNGGGLGGWDPLEGGLPAYVLMVGIGVCAVVLQTVIRRWVGRKV